MNLALLGIRPWAAVLCVATVTASAQSEAPIPRPVHQPGDRWTLTVIDGWTDQEIRRYTVRYEGRQDDRLLFRNLRQDGSS
jgi:hypothetical protein